METMKVWNAFKQPPVTALKTIGAGRLKGKSDINPQWRYQAMTEQFGPCGTGWKFTVDKLWTEPTADGQVFAFASVSVFFWAGEAWSDPIPGLGGSMLIAKESSGLHANDEGFKMAVTDALGTAMKMLGVAADIYAGKWDGTKYATEESGPEPNITTDQEIELNDLLDSTKSDRAGFLKYFKVDKVSNLPASKYKTALAMLQKKVK